MTIRVAIIDGPITAADVGLPADVSGHAGAIVRFDGVVRDREDGRPLAALEYTVYEPMAARELERLARETRDRYGLKAITALHSRGRVPAGQTSFVLVVAAAHRREALAATGEFIERLKQDVPIWKSPVWNPSD